MCGVRKAKGKTALNRKDEFFSGAFSEISLLVWMPNGLRIKDDFTGKQKKARTTFNK